MYNNMQSPVMIIKGKKADMILKKTQKPISNHADAVKKAKKRLRKAGYIG